MAEIKFCGLTQAGDAAFAASLGAQYVGAVLADSPRRLSTHGAGAVFADLPTDVGRTGVFGPGSPTDVVAAARLLSLRVVQLHGDPDAAAVAAVRRAWNGEIWAVQRIGDGHLPAGLAELLDAADGVVLDARVEGKLGGTGAVLPWATIETRLRPLRHRRARLILAGGLTPGNVAEAIVALRPDVVDVSSGVESSVGVKDHDKMRAFCDAVRAATAA